MSETMASLAILMFWNEPSMWIFLYEGSLRERNSIPWVRADSRVRQDNTRPARVLDGELRLAVLAGDAA